MMGRGRVQSSKNREGFTTVELIIGLTLGLIVLTGVYQLLVSQGRLYGVQREVMDTHQSLRSTAALFSSQLWGASARGGDLYAIGPNSMTLRSLQGTGIVCSKHSTASRLALSATSGVFDTTADDSAVVFATDINSWIVVSIDLIHPNTASVPWCDWGGGSSIEPDIVLDVSLVPTLPTTLSGEISIEAQGTVAQGATVTITVSHPALTCAEFDSRALISIDVGTWATSNQPMSGCTFSVTLDAGSDKLHITINIESDLYPQLSDDITVNAEWPCDASGCGADGGGGESVTEYVEVGAAFHGFRRIEYSLFTQDGRWWLGQRVGAASTYDILTGPLLPPGDSGLVFTYYDMTGAVTATPAEVAPVQILMRAESFGAPSGVGSHTLRDSMTTMVFLRGN